jgi:hypothetical protein
MRAGSTGSEDVGGDAGVGGDACHQPGLGDTDLAGGERRVPDTHCSAQSGFLHAAVGFGAGELQVVLHPRLRGEEPLAPERLGGVDVVGGRDRGGGRLASQRLDSLRPRCGRGGIEPRRIDRFERGEALRAVLDHRLDPLDTERPGGNGDIDHRIEPPGLVGEPHEPVTEHRGRYRRLRRHQRILHHGHATIMTRRCDTVPHPI